MSDVIWYEVLEFGKEKVHNNPTMFGYDTNGEYLQSVALRLKNWHGFVGKQVKVDYSDEHPDKTGILLRFSDGSEEWFYPWMLKEVDGPPDDKDKELYVTCKDKLDEIFPMI